MPNDLEAIAKTLLNSPQGSEVLGNYDKIRDYMNKPEGKQILSMLSGKNGDAVKSAAAAAARGDQETAKRLLTSVLSTPDGAKLAKIILEMMK